MNVTRLLTGTTLLCCLWSVDTQAAESAPLPAESPKIHTFQRVFVPAEQFDDFLAKHSDELPRGDARYNVPPISGQKFQELTEKLQAESIPELEAMRVARAEYTARLEGDQLVDGKASLQLTRLREDASFVPLTGCGLAISEPRSMQPTELPATLNSTAAGLPMAIIDLDAEDLRFNWSLRGDSSGRADIEFRLRLPQCPLNRLTLDLPPGSCLVVPGHEVVHGSAVTGRNAAPPVNEGGGASTALPNGPVGELWQVDLGGQTDVTLRILSVAAGPRNVERAICQQRIIYAVARNGTEVDAKFHINASHAATGQLKVQLDRRLNVTNAWLGRAASQVAVPWVSGYPTPGGPQHVTLELPQRLTGRSHLIRLEAVAAAELGKLSQLPSVLARDVTWLETRIAVRVPEPLVVKRIVPSGCVQTGISGLSAPQRGESLEFLLREQEGGLKLLVDFPPSRIEVDTGTTVSVSPVLIKADVTADFRTDQGEIFELQAEIPGNWEVDSVSVVTIAAEGEVPTSVLDDWEMHSRVGKKRLLLSLSRALTPDRPLRCRISGRRRNAPGQKLGIYDFRFVRFPDTDRPRHLTSIAAVGPRPLQDDSDIGLSRLSAEQLTEADRTRLRTPPKAYVFVDDETASNVVFSLGSEKPNFTAVTRVDATVSATSLIESFRIRCIPDSNPLGRLLVYASQTSDVTVTWTFGEQDGQSVSARPLAPVELLAEGLEAGGQAWFVELPGPQSDPFEVTGRRRISLTPNMPVSLVAVPEAKAQRATLTIRSANAGTPLINNLGLRSVPFESPSPDRTTSVRAAFRYEPARDALAVGEPPVTLSPASTDEGRSGAWIWSVRLSSRFGRQTPAQHVARFYVENASRNDVVIRMPDNVTVRRLTVSGNGQPTELPIENGRETNVPLPPGVRYPEITITFETEATGLSHFNRAEPVFPQADVPILSRRWDVWLPPGQEILGRDRRLSSTGSPPPTLAKRLFGPLWRGSAAPPFHLFSSSDWSALAEPDRDTQEARAAAEMVIVELGHATGKLDPQRESHSWGELLQQYDLLVQTERFPPPPLLVDDVALAEVGVLPTATAGVPTDGTDRQRGTELLKQAKLVLLSTPEAVLLTTGNAVSRNHDQLAEDDFDEVWRVLRGPLRDKMRASLANGSYYSPLAAWMVLSPAQSAPWNRGVSPPSLAQLDHNWTVRTVQIESDQPQGVLIYRPAIVRSLAWAVFFATVVVVFLMVGRRRKGWLFCLTGATAAAWLIPEPLCPIGSGMFLGVLAAGLLRLPLPLGRSAKHAAPIAKAAGSAITLAAWGALLLSFWAASAACGQNVGTAEKVEAGPARRPVHSVLVPVDKQGVPTGLYYLPKELYDLLHRYEGPAAAASPRWWLKSAEYDATLDWLRDESRLHLVRLTASYRVETLQHNSLVRLPVSREGDNVTAADTGVSVDGRPIQPRWQADGRAAVIPIDSPGEYRIQIEYLASQSESATAAGFDLPIPALANATLELTVPTDVPDIELPTALGQVTDHRDDGRITAQLGPAERLAVSWLKQPAVDPAMATTRVEQLLWIDVRPGAAILTTIVELHVDEGEMRRLRMTADAGLQFLTHKGLEATVSVSTGTDESQILDVVFQQPVTGTVRFELAFLIADAFGGGQLRLPRVDVAGANVGGAKMVKRSLGVTADAAFRLEESHDSAVMPIPADDFAAAWGGGWGPRLPRQAFRLPNDEQPVWSLAVSGVEPQTQVRQQTVATAGRREMEITVTADLETTGGDVFGHQLSVPPRLQVDSIELSCQGLDQRVRWFHDRPGEIALRLSAAVSGSQELRLRGRLLTPPGKPTKWSPVRVVGATQVDERIRLDRRFGTLVDDIKTSGEMTGVTPPSQPSGQVRTIRTWDVSGDTPSIELTVRPNNPQTRARLITRVDRRAETWRTLLDYRLTTQKGLVDELHFEVPFEVVEPLEKIDPPCNARIVALTGTSSRRLVIRPHQAIDDEFHLRIAAPLAISPGESMRVPEVRPVGVDEVDMFVVVPTRLEQQQIEWETQGLRPADLSSVAFTDGESANWAVFRVAGRSGQAVLKAVRRTKTAPRVLLADSHVAWLPAGRYGGVTRFQIAPAGRTGCTLQLPNSCDLIHVSIDGIPGLLYPLNKRNQWRLAWGPEQLPQRIDVVFRGQADHSPPHVAPDDQGPRASFSWVAFLDGPVLKGLPVEHSMWTVHPLGTAHIDAWSRSGPVRQERDRLQKKINVLNLPANVIAENTPAELADWYLPWARERAATVRRLDYLQQRYGPVRDPERNFGETLPQLRQQWDARLGTAVANQEAEEQSGRAFEPAALFAPMRSEPAVAAHYSWSSPPVRFTDRAAEPKAYNGTGFGYAEPSPPGFGARLSAFLGVLAAGLVAWILLRRRWHGDLLVGSPRLVGVLVGLAWWLWLAPSILGWFIVLLSLVPPARSLTSAKNESDTARLKTKGLPLGRVGRRG